MKKGILAIILMIMALALITVGTVIIFNTVVDPEDITETDLRKPKKKDVYGDEAIVDEKLNEPHKYKNIEIKNISYERRGTKYFFEATVSNESKKQFAEKYTDIVFYTNTKEVIGTFTIELPVLAPNQEEYVIFEITEGKYFDACDFSLQEKVELE